MGVAATRSTIGLASLRQLIIEVIALFDIFAIRDQLNEVAFEGGKRECCIGKRAELFADLDAEAAARELENLESLLRSNDLSLEVRADKALFVVQQLKTREVDPKSMARAIQAVSNITTVALEMVVPIVIGMWLDKKLDTQFLGIVGIMLGVPLGIWHLIKLTRTKGTRAE